VGITEIKRLAKVYLARAQEVEADQKAPQQAIGQYCLEKRGGTLRLAQELGITVQHVSDISHDRWRVSTKLAEKVTKLKMS
jgi:hypothetical protein